MISILETNRTKVITSPNGHFSCIIDNVNEDCVLYRIFNKDLLFHAKFKGQGIFLNDDILLLFYNSSGYGYWEGDSYFYFLKSGKILPLYYDSYEALLNSNNWSGGYHISFSSNILVTDLYLIMKDEFGGVYFYNKDRIIKTGKLDFIFYLSTTEDRKIDMLHRFNDNTQTLAYSNYDEGCICEVFIDFNSTTAENKSGISLQFKDENFTGKSLDYHTISSKINDDGSLETIRTTLGEALYQLKYRSRKEYISVIAEAASNYINSEFHEIDIIIPIPPSDLNRNFQPLLEIANLISQITKIPLDCNYLHKKFQNPPIKGIDDFETRKRVLSDAYTVIDDRYKGKSVLLLDDLYRSGATLNAAAKSIKEDGLVGNINVITITKTRTKR